MWEDVSQLGTIQLGHFKEPFGLEHLNSFRHIPFMERSLANALMPSRGVGVMARNTIRQGRLAWALGIFYETDTVDNISDSRAFALTGRVSGLPVYRDEGEELLHVGLAISQRALDAPVRIRVRPEVNLAPRYLDTEDFSADSLSILNLEAAYLRGPLQLQAEFAYMLTSGSVIEEDATLNDVADEIAARLPRLYEWLAGRGGWQRPSDSILWNIPFDLMARGEPQFFSTYAQVSYVLTGETRLYNQSRGLFGPIIPENPVRFREMRGTGAWEISARLSHIDLNDRFISGGRETNLTLGINWYLNKHARIMANYVHGEVARDGYDGSFDAFQTRFQLDFQTQALHEFLPVQMIRNRME
jgi:phosphate-selective porin OprO/OprP